MKLLTHLLVNMVFSLSLLAQGTIQWQKSYGGSDSDIVINSTATSDGGFLVGVVAASTNGWVTGNHGATDVWLIKVGGNGVVQWRKCLGGFDTDAVARVIELSEGGYAILASTRSDGLPGSGQVVENNGEQDYWVARLSTTGDILWAKCYGGRHQEDARWMIQKTDGTLVLVGSTISFEVVNANGVFGGYNGYVLGVSPVDGTILWERVIGGSGLDYLYAAVETPEGNLTLTGVSDSYDGDMANTLNQGSQDLWVCQIDPAGDILWNYQYGGSNNDGGRALVQTNTGEYLVTGITYSFDGDVYGYQAGQDIWLMNLAADGSMLWNRALGGSGNDAGFAIAQINANKFMVAGETSSFDGDISDNHGGRDAVIFTMDFNGEILNERCLGGSQDDFTRSIIPVGTSGLFVAATAGSNDGDATQNSGNFDAWLVKLDIALDDKSGLSEAAAFEVKISPNPVADLLQITTTMPGAKTFQVLDAQGKLMQTIETTDMNIDCPVAAYPAGVYYVKMANATAIPATSKELGTLFVKQ